MTPFSLPRMCRGSQPSVVSGDLHSLGSVPRARHLNIGGELGLAIDVPHTGDSIIRRDSVLIADGRLAARLPIWGLDFPSGPGGGGGFTLGWRPSSGFGNSDGQSWAQ